MKARLVQGVSAACVIIGALLAMIGNTVAAVCTSTVCVQVWTVAGLSVLASGLVALVIVGIVAQGGKIF